MDKNIITAPLKSLNNHTWYLTEQNVLLSLFDPHCSLDLKDKMRLKLLEKPSSSMESSYYHRPELPVLCQDNSYQLSDFIGTKSWNFFEILNIDTTFLYSPVSEWNKQESFLHGQEVVSRLHVTNDPAERAVKLCTDYIDSCRSEERLQIMFQVASEN